MLLRSETIHHEREGKDVRRPSDERQNDRPEDQLRMKCMLVFEDAQAQVNENTCFGEEGNRTKEDGDRLTAGTGEILMGVM